MFYLYLVLYKQWGRQSRAGVGGGGATAPLSGSASPPVGENLYICRGKLTKIWPTVPNHEKKYSPPPVREHSPSVGKFQAPPLFLFNIQKKVVATFRTRVKEYFL